LKENKLLEDKQRQTSINYLMDFSQQKIENEKERLSHCLYGPQILIAKSREEYYKFITSRKHAVLRLGKLVEIEQAYSKEDKYFEQVKYFKEKLEAMREFSIRGLLDFFYYKKYF
jgi:tRNA A37 N6-isopentenylltransferase MiaA